MNERTQTGSQLLSVPLTWQVCPNVTLIAAEAQHLQPQLSLEQHRRQASSMDSSPDWVGGKSRESVTKRLKHSALDSWLTSACFSTEIGFIDNFNSAWNFREHFNPDWFDPDCQPPSCPWKQEHNDRLPG